MSNYTYLKFVYLITYYSSIGNGSVVYPVEFITKTASGGSDSSPKAKMSIGGMQTSVSTGVRLAYRVSDTQIYFSVANRLNGSSTNTSQAIPLEIIGIK